MKNVTFEKDFNVEYVRGPLKTKAESDYWARAFPNSACLVDIVGCQCVYENPSDLCEALDATMARIEKGDTALKRVLRVKNLLRFIWFGVVVYWPCFIWLSSGISFLRVFRFITNKQRLGTDTNDWMYEYACYYFVLFHFVLLILSRY